jgi:glutathione S-transferase
MKLYEFAPTRSIRARWTLQELGVDFEAVTVNLVAGEHRRPEFLAVNPSGKIPVLVDDDIVLTESVAIVVYLAEKYPASGFLPSDPNARAEVMRWLLFTRPNLSSRCGGFRSTASSIPRTNGCRPISHWRVTSSRRWPRCSTSTWWTASLSSATV